MKSYNIKKLFGILLLPSFFLNADTRNLIITPLGKIDSTNSSLERLRDGYFSKNTFGMRANAVVLAARANPDEQFNYPINGFDNSKEISSSGDRDSVGLYADNSSQRLNSWQILNFVHYHKDFFSTSNKNVLDNLKPGMIIETMHNPKWTTYVTAVTGNVVHISGWFNSKLNSGGVPSDGSGLIINPISKIWATNFNIFLNPGGQANAGVIQENGLINNSLPNSNVVNGLDTVILPSSKFGGTAAYLSRSSGGGYKQQWQYGFLAQGSSKANFLSTDSISNKPINFGYQEDSHSSVGFSFSGNNKISSIQWMNGKKIVSSISPTGEITKIAFKTKLISKNQSLTLGFSRYIVNSSSDITLNLPNASAVSDGITLQVFNFSNKKIKFVSKDTKINQAELLTSNITLIYSGKQWYIL